MQETGLEGIVTLEVPGGHQSHGRFTPPDEFDRKRYSGEFVETGPEIEKRKGVQPIVGTNKGARGWEVWVYPKGAKNAGKPHRVHDGKKEYTLMFRKKTISENVNAIYGNVSKRHLIRAQGGDVLGNVPIGDKGILAHEKLSASGYKDFGDEYQMNVPENKETTAPQVEAEPDATGSSVPDQ